MMLHDRLAFFEKLRLLFTFPTPPAQQQQQTLAGKILRGLCTGFFYLQLVLVSAFVIFLTLRVLLFAKSPSFQPKKWYSPLLASIVISGFLSLAWQYCLLCKIKITVKATFWLTPILTIMVGIFLLVEGSSVVQVIGLVIVIFSILQAAYGWSYVIQEKREYTFKILSICTRLPIPRIKVTVCVSVTCCVIYSGLLVAGIGEAITRRTRVDIIQISMITISLTWTLEVLKNLILLTISKTAYIYYVDDDARDAFSELGISLKNQVGSVCIGSTIIPIFGFIRGLIRTCNKIDNVNDQNVYDNIEARSCNWIVNNLILWGNTWGFVHVGVYSTNIIKASSDTWKMFRKVAGLEELIDSDLTSSICFLAAIAVGAISALTAELCVFLIYKEYIFDVTIYAFIIGYFTATVASAWLQGCVMGYYVAYSEAPKRYEFDETVRRRIEQQDAERRKEEATEVKEDRKDNENV